MSNPTVGRAALLPFPTLGRAAPARVPRPERWTLANGLRVLAVRWTTLPQVAARLVFPGGSIADPAAAPGTAAFVGAMLTEGTTAAPADLLNARLDRLGASLGVQVGHDFAEVDLFMLAETLADGFGLLADVVRSPAFPAAELERVRAETLDALEARDDEPANVADDALGAALFGEVHPYGRPAVGTPDGVAAVSAELLRDFHSRHYRPDGGVLIVAGDFDLDHLRAEIDRAFGGWEGTAERPAYPAPAAADAPGTVRRVGWTDAAQGEIRFGGPGLARTSPDWIPASVANYLLGGSTITGRLGANLREDKGWTYGIRSGFAAAVQPGGWVIETAVDAAVIDRAVEEIRGELHRLLSEPIPEEELRRAKDAIILSLPRAFETPGRIVGRLGTVEVYGLPPDYWERLPAAVEAISAEEVSRVAERHFHADRLVRVIVGPA